MSKLSAEVARQRPLWEQSKQLEEVHHAKLAEVRTKLPCGEFFLCDCFGLTFALLSSGSFETQDYVGDEWCGMGKKR